jgi:hypothetical protein
VKYLGAPTCRQRSHFLSGIQSEADLHCHLPVRNLVILEVAAHLTDLKPPHISDRLASSRDRIVHCVFDAVWRRTDQLNLFGDVVTHKRIKPLHVASGEHIPRSKDAGYPSKCPNIPPEHIRIPRQRYRDDPQPKSQTPPTSNQLSPISPTPHFDEFMTAIAARLVRSQLHRHGPLLFKRTVIEASNSKWDGPRIAGEIRYLPIHWKAAFPSESHCQKSSQTRCPPRPFPGRS